MTNEFIKVNLTDHLGSCTMKHFIKQNSSRCSLYGKIGIKINNTDYTLKETN